MSASASTVFPASRGRATTAAVRLPLLLAAALWLAPALAWAEGGAHVVDDSEVETPGHCHVELWGTYIDPGAGLVNIGPGCTHRAFPDFEIGAFVQPSRSTGASAAGSAGPGSTGPGATVASTDALFGPALKYTFRHDDTGLGVGLDAGFTYNGSRRRLEAVSALLPFTVHPTKWLTVNVNAGAQYIRDDRALESFLGAQAVVALGHGVSFMAEQFGRSRAFSGRQFGLRWTPTGRNFDLDLVGGRRIDGVSGTALSLGITLRT